MSWPDRATCEEYDPLQLLVVEEVVERPEAPLFTKRVGVQIRVVATNKHQQDKILLAQLVTITTGRVKKKKYTHTLPVNVTALQVDLLVDGIPQFWPQRVEFLPHCWEQAAVHCVSHLWKSLTLTQSSSSAWHGNIRPRSDRKLHTNPVEAGFSAELVGSRRAEVVVGPEGLIKCCDEVEQSLPATLVAQGVLPVLAALPQPWKGKKREFDVFINVEVLHHPGVTHSEGLAALLDWGGESASRTCGSPSWQNCLNICLSSPAILQE